MTSLSYDALTEHIESGGSGSGDIPTGYDESAYFTISSVEDADTFSSRFHHSTDSSIPSYYDSTTGTTLALGNRININDGTYNTQWMIAGFDVEYNRTATDGITYNNGYGIALIPVTYVTTAVWDDTVTEFANSTKYNNYLKKKGHTSYSSSKMNIETLPAISAALKNVLGDHLIERNVLLGASVCDWRLLYSGDVTANNPYTKYYYSTGYTTAYTWTTSIATLLSTMQVTGIDMGSVSTTENYASGNATSGYTGHNDNYGANKYDQGEANYKLPIFDNIDAYNNYLYMTRAVQCVCGIYDTILKNVTYVAFQHGSSVEYANSTLSRFPLADSVPVRPMIYVR